MAYTLSRILLDNKWETAQLEQLLQREHIHRDANLDYVVGLYDEDDNLIATGACFANTLRCLAVDDRRQGEGLLAQIVTHLIEYQMSCGNAHLFLYTKCDKAAFFESLGFYEIARVDERMTFMENRRTGFSDFLASLSHAKREGRSAALVMNCNPFTLGHRYLVEQAAAMSDTVHLFVVSEDASLFPFEDRYAMIQAGTADLNNVILHRTGSYMISSAVFPSYFLEDDAMVIEMQGRLDVLLFARIAQVLGIARRYVGEEPFSKVTGIYNKIMMEQLPAAGIACIVIPRWESEGRAVSASQVRQLIHDDRLEEIRPLVPATTYQYFFTEAGKETIKRIQAAEQVAHY